MDHLLSKEYNMHPSNFSKLDVGAHSVVVVENFDSLHTILSDVKRALFLPLFSC